MLSRLDGSFIIIIYSPDETIVARDRHGLNSPIYYTKESFSSSLYELTRNEGVDRIPDYNSLAFFLSAGYIKAPDSSFKHIFKLEAGHVLVFREGRGKTINLFPPEEVIPDVVKNKYEPGAIVYHKDGTGSRRDNPLHEFYMYRARILFVRRNQSGLYKLLSCAYIACIAAPRKVLVHLLHKKGRLAKAVASGIFEGLRAEYK